MLLGDWIKKERKKKFPSQYEFAAAVDASQASVSLWENNKVIPSIPTLAVIVRSFGMSLKDIPFERIENLEEANSSIKSLELVELQGERIVTEDGREYHLKALIGVSVESGEFEVIKAKGGTINCSETK